MLAFDFIPPTTGRPAIVPPYAQQSVRLNRPTNPVERRHSHSPPGTQPPSRLSEVSSKARSVTCARSTTCTVLGPVSLPPKPVMNARVATEVSTTHNAPPSRVDRALDELEDAFDEEQTLAPPVSKANASRKRRRENDETAAPSALPPRNTTPRFSDQPLDEYDHDDSDFDDPMVSTPVSRQCQLARDLDSARDLWYRADHPSRENEYIVMDQLSPGVLTLLRRGRKFMELVPSLGVNQATKTSRKAGRKRGAGFNSQCHEFEELARAHNREVARLRSARPLKKQRK